MENKSFGKEIVMEKYKNLQEIPYKMLFPVFFTFFRKILIFIRKKVA